MYLHIDKIDKDTMKQIILKLVSSESILRNYILVYDMCVKHVYFLI